jgi:hypothetical protein
LKKINKNDLSNNGISSATPPRRIIFKLLFQVKLGTIIINPTIDKSITFEKN